MRFSLLGDFVSKYFWSPVVAPALVAGAEVCDRRFVPRYCTVWLTAKCASYRRVPSTESL